MVERGTRLNDATYITLRCGVVVTGSVGDIDIWNSHRWRLVNDEVVTTVHNGEYEVPISAGNVLLGLSKSAHVVRRTQNPYDYRREVFTLTPTNRNNSILTKGDVSYLVTTDGKTVRLDTADVEKVRNYVWTTHTNNTSTSIYTRTTISGTTKRLQLARLILGLPLGSHVRVRHRNGDVYDVRRENLEILQ